MDKNIYAVIAIVLYEYRGNNIHDTESDKITIRPKQNMWDAKFASFAERSRQYGAE